MENPDWTIAFLKAIEYVEAMCVSETQHTCLEGSSLHQVTWGRSSYAGKPYTLELFPRDFSHEHMRSEKLIPTVK